MGARKGLDRDAVLRVAREIVDEQGWPALSLHEVARRAGVKTPSLYAHVSGLDDLRDALALAAAQAMREALDAAGAGLAGEAALRAMFFAYRDFARAHPGLYAALQRGGDPATGDPLAMAQYAIVEVVLRRLAGVGIVAMDAIHAARGLRAALHGFVTLDAEGGFGLPADVDASFARLVDMLLAGLSARGRA